MTHAGRILEQLVRRPPAALEREPLARFLLQDPAGRVVSQKPPGKSPSRRVENKGSETPAEPRPKTVHFRATPGDHRTMHDPQFLQLEAAPHPDGLPLETRPLYDQLAGRYPEMAPADRPPSRYWDIAPWALVDSVPVFHRAAKHFQEVRFFETPLCAAKGENRTNLYHAGQLEDPQEFLVLSISLHPFGVERSALERWARASSVELVIGSKVFAQLPAAGAVRETIRLPQQPLAVMIRRQHFFSLRIRTHVPSLPRPEDRPFMLYAALWGYIARPIQ